MTASGIEQLLVSSRLSCAVARGQQPADVQRVVGVVGRNDPRVDREDAEKPDSTYVAVNVLPVPWVSPGDVSNVVTFLASDASEHLTGLVIPVDAGYLIKK
jgi:NAD(P)-dependent dehydrogenase (short-subunit alcohol dehydrogenase family)